MVQERQAPVGHTNNHLDLVSFCGFAELSLVNMKLILVLALVAGCLYSAVGQGADLAPASFDPQILSPATGTSAVPANAPAPVLAIPEAGEIGSTAPGPGLKGHLSNLMKLYWSCTTFFISILGRSNGRIGLFPGLQHTPGTHCCISCYVTLIAMRCYIWGRLRSLSF